MPISKEDMNPNINNPVNSDLHYPTSSRPSGVAGHIASRPTMPSGDFPYDSSDDEMKYGRIVKIIRASSKI